MKDKILDSMVLKKHDPCTPHAVSPAWTSNLSLISLYKRNGGWEMVHLLKDLLHKHLSLNP